MYNNYYPPPEPPVKVEQKCEYCLHIFCAAHEELTHAGKPIPVPCPDWKQGKFVTREWLNRK